MHLRIALRSLRRTPWYSSTVIGVVALSIALAATVFAVVDGVLFRLSMIFRSGVGGVSTTWRPAI